MAENEFPNDLITKAFMQPSLPKDYLDAKKLVPSMPHLALVRALVGGMFDKDIIGLEEASKISDELLNPHHENFDPTKANAKMEAELAKKDYSMEAYQRLLDKARWTMGMRMLEEKDISRELPQVLEDCEFSLGILKGKHTGAKAAVNTIRQCISKMGQTDGENELRKFIESRINSETNPNARAAILLVDNMLKTGRIKTDIFFETDDGIAVGQKKDAEWAGDFLKVLELVNDSEDFTRQASAIKIPQIAPEYEEMKQKIFIHGDKRESIYGETYKQIGSYQVLMGNTNATRAVEILRTHPENMMNVLRRVKECYYAKMTLKELEGIAKDIVLLANTLDPRMIVPLYQFYLKLKKGPETKTDTTPKHKAAYLLGYLGSALQSMTVEYEDIFKIEPPRDSSWFWLIQNSAGVITAREKNRY